MMSIFLTQALERQNRDDTIYYFCNSEDDRNSTSSAILRALIWQIMAKRPELASLVMPHFQLPERTQAVLSTPGTLFEIFVKLAKDPSMAPMYCLIDGLDECEHDSIRWIASHLAELHHETQLVKMRICIVSRDVPELRQTKQILLDPDNNDKVETDIETFTSLKMRDLTRRHNLSNDLSLQIQGQLLRKAEGTFLWIGYAMDELLAKATVIQVLDALGDLPAALPALYSRMIRGIAVDKLQACISILRWVVLAMKPLTVNELADAVEWHTPSQLTPEQAAQDYISLCKSLISIQDNRVGVVHQSVKDYLLRTQLGDDPVVESVRIKIEEGHLAMADRCLKALEDGSAFGHYANLFWPEHAKQCGKLASPWILENDCFFRERSELCSRWWPIYFKASSYVRRVTRGIHLTSDPPELHMACFTGFTKWVQHILFRKRWLLNPWKRPINHCGKDLATPLHFAVYGFNSGIVEYLLDNGADPNIKFQEDLSPFTFAILFLDGFSRGHAILERMIARGADASQLLHRAINSHNVHLVELGIKYSANLNLFLEDTGLTCLHLTVLNWQYDQDNAIIRRLLEAGADPYTKDIRGRTALQYSQHPDVVKARRIAVRSVFEEFGHCCAWDLV